MIFIFPSLFSRLTCVSFGNPPIFETYAPCPHFVILIIKTSKFCYFDNCIRLRYFLQASSRIISASSLVSLVTGEHNLHLFTLSLPFLCILSLSLPCLCILSLSWHFVFVFAFTLCTLSLSFCLCEESLRSVQTGMLSVPD